MGIYSDGRVFAIGGKGSVNDPRTHTGGQGFLQRTNQRVRIRLYTTYERKEAKTWFPCDTRILERLFAGENVVKGEVE